MSDSVTNESFYLVNQLISSTNYTFYVRSYSKEAASDQSNIVICETGKKT